MVKRVCSPATTDALALLGVSIRAARLRRRWTVEELAERVGVSKPTITKVERGDPGVAIGTVLEAATLVGVPLFEASAPSRARYAAQKRAELALLPAAARPAPEVDDDF